MFMHNLYVDNFDSDLVLNTKNLLAGVKWPGERHVPDVRCTTSAIVHFLFSSIHSPCMWNHCILPIVFLQNSAHTTRSKSFVRNVTIWSFLIIYIYRNAPCRWAVYSKGDGESRAVDGRRGRDDSRGSRGRLHAARTGPSHWSRHARCGWVRNGVATAIEPTGPEKSQDGPGTATGYGAHRGTRLLLYRPVVRRGVGRPTTTNVSERGLTVRLSRFQWVPSGGRGFCCPMRCSRSCAWRSIIWILINTVVK